MLTFLLNFALVFTAHGQVLDKSLNSKTPTASTSDSPLNLTPKFNSLKKNQSSVEKVEVTGSRIKRIDVEGASPVMVIDQEDLRSSGYNSVADVLRDTTISSFGVEREYSDESNSVGAATIGLRGLSSDKTLILMDGRRLPKIDGGNSVDLNLIPFEAIERVEILKDGASAVYGSDALAGVINFITKKDFDGSLVKFRYSQPEARGGTRQDISATYGKNWNNGNILAVYQYRNNQRVMSRDREWSRGGLSSYSYPPTIRQANQENAQWKASPACPEGRVQQGDNGSSICTFDYSRYTSSLPDTEQHSVMLNGRYDFNANLEAFARTTMTQRQVRWQWAPSADDFRNQENVGGKDYTIPQKTAQKTGFTSAPGDMELRYRTVTELGPRASRDTTQSYGIITGLKGYFSDTWEWEGTLNTGYSKLFNQRHAGYGNSSALFQGILANKVRPFEFNPAAAPINEVQHTGEQFIRSNITTANFVSTGELGQALGGQWAMVAGVSSGWESYSVTVDSVTAAGDLFGGIGEQGEGSRNYQSAFSEIALNYESLELSLAGRFDNYSDFGGTFNPKFSVRWNPLKSWVLRSSIGTGFRAPSLDELYSGTKYDYPWFRDLVACQKQGINCDEQQYRVFSGGNPNLKEETSLSFNIGTVVQPTRRWSLSLDFWETTVNNAVGLDNNDLMFAESVLGNEGLKPHGITVNRKGGIIEEVVAPNLNLASQKSQGVEFTTRYAIPIGRMNWMVRMDHSHLTMFQEEIFPGLGLRNKLGENQFPAWRNTVTVGLGLRNHTWRLAGRTIAGQYKSVHFSNPTITSRIPTYTEYDINYTWNTPWSGQIAFGIKNLLDSDRPLDDSAGFSNRFNTSLYDQLGRLYFLGYTQTF